MKRALSICRENPAGHATIGADRIFLGESKWWLGSGVSKVFIRYLYPE